MAKFLIEVPDEQAAQLAEAFAQQFGYSETVLDTQGITTPNPMTKNEFWTLQTGKYWQNVLDNYKAAEAARIALEAQQASLTPFQVQLTATAVP